MKISESRVLTQVLPEQYPEDPWCNIEIPADYFITCKGVFEIDHKNGAQHICGPLWEVAKTRDTQGFGWGMVLQWLDQDGALREQSFPVILLHENRNSLLVKQLAHQGLKIFPKKNQALHNYIAAFETKRRKIAIAQTGWHVVAKNRLVYVLPNEIINCIEGEDVVFQPEQRSPNAEAIHAKGSLEQWRSEVSKQCLGNPVLIFSCCTAFAGSLLKFVELDCTGFHLHGYSSQGKTTALQVAASVWGNGADPAGSPGAYVQRWNATANAFEAIAANHNDGFLALDEMATCGVKDFGQVVYNLSGGRGKDRLSKEAIQKEKREWRIVYLSSGEISAKQKIEIQGGNAKAGQLNRLLDIPVTEKIILECGEVPPRIFADKLKSACGQYYGTAGNAYLKYLLEKNNYIEVLQGELKNRLDSCVERLMPERPLTSDTARSIKRFGLVLLAGELAVEAGVVAFKACDVLDAAIVCRDAWLAAYVDEALTGILSVRDCIQRFWESRFWHMDKHVSDGPIIRDALGYWDESRSLFIFHDAGFKEACNGVNESEVAKGLDALGLLHRTDSKRLKSKHNLPDMDKRVNLYAVKRDLLSYEFNANAE